MSKKLVNEPQNAVDECLSGFTSVHTGVQLLEGCRGVIRSDLDLVRAEGHVLVLCGGGSGHEPAFSDRNLQVLVQDAWSPIFVTCEPTSRGWGNRGVPGGHVGPGMLTAAVPGSIFASPPPADIQAVLETIGHDHPAGVLVIVLNYTGDRLNFGMAVENARNLGVRVATVTVGEDCALASQDRTAGRRGLTGAMFILKIAGGLADEGRSLEEIHEILTEATSKMGSIGLSLSPCSVPGHKPSFTLGPDEMELGLGVHGEAGVRRMKILPARQAVAAMSDHMTNPASKTCLSIKRGDRIAVLLNNLGGTSQMEMGILAKEAIAYLESLGASVERAYCGSFITSMEMAGVILSVLHLDGTLKRALDAPTTVPGWFSPMLAPGQNDRLVLARRPLVRVRAANVVEKGVECDSATSDLIRRAISKACEAMIRSENHLNELDTEAGDGDCGSTVKRGAQAILAALDGLNLSKPSQLVSQISNIVSQSMGGTSGALYSLFFSSSAGPLLESSNSRSWLKAYKSGMDAIMKYGAAQVGDRTMMYPGYVALEQGIDKDPLNALKRAAEASEAGATRTSGMAARAGRASYVHSDHLHNPDAGAVAFSIWLRAVYECLDEDN